MMFAFEKYTSPKMWSIWKSWISFLEKPVDSSGLVLFRMLFGALMAVDLLDSWDWRVTMLTQRPIHFPFYGFGWLPLLPEWLAIIVQTLLIASSLCIAFGCFFRTAAFTFVLGYSYSFVIDRAYFNNHYYLICLLGLWLLLGHSNRRWSLDVLRKSIEPTNKIPQWQALGPAIQMAIPYFFGGLAKLNPDWLRGEPARYQVYQISDNPLYSFLVSQSWSGIFFAWSGLLFDLFIVPMLLWRKTRAIAICLLVFFHVTNSVMFNIGIFPWLGIAGIVLFLPPSSLTRFLHYFSTPDNSTSDDNEHVIKTLLNSSNIIGVFFCCWFAIQCLLPLRHYFIPGNVGWTCEGFYFAWTMKLDVKSCFLNFHICDAATGRCVSVDHHKDLTDYQQYFLPREPKGIVQYAKFLKSQAIIEGLQDPVIVCDSICSLNGRPYQYMIDPQQDPAELTIPRFFHAQWIVPLNTAAPIGNYKTLAQKNEVVMQLARQTRLDKNIWPKKLRGKKIVDVTPKKRDSQDTNKEQL